MISLLLLDYDKFISWMENELYKNQMKIWLKWLNNIVR